MADLTLQERLQPSLLDRLFDSEPDKKQETRNQRVLSENKLRACVLRDLTWLLNSTNFESVHSMDSLTQVATSVINYGVPDLNGVPASGIDVVQLERGIRNAIEQFEPRILSESLRVSVIKNSDEMRPNSLMLTIQGELWAQPVPVELFLRTELDLEVGLATVAEFRG